VAALADFFDELRAERRKVVRGAARDEPLIDVHLFVDPGRAGVAEIGRAASPGSTSSPSSKPSVARNATRFPER
jgi:hypothetical protein